MIELLVTVVAVITLSLIHSLLLAWFVSPTLGDFWPTVWLIFPVNCGFYLMIDWMSGYLKTHIRNNT